MKPDRGLAEAEERGRRSVAAMRDDPELVTRAGIGRWFEARPRRRIARRLLCRLPAGLRSIFARLGRRAGTLAIEAAFWSGVREAATAAEWARLTRSSYVVLYYHRLAGEGKPGQERLDLPPAQFTRQLRLLQRLGFRALGPEQVLDFHRGTLDRLPARSFVVTADDGFLDCVEPFLRHAKVRPQLYVPTAEVGGRSWWAGEEALAGWPELRRLASAGVGIGSHSHRHLRLPELSEQELREELEASRRTLSEHVPEAIPMLAYPHGQRDPRVRAAVSAAGFELALTTDPGRNGIGTNPFELRRVGVKAWDSRLSFLWKVATGELLPARWERRRIKRRPWSRPRRPSHGPGDA